MHETLINDVKLHIDSILDQGEDVSVSGWCASTSSKIENVRLKKDDLTFSATYGGERKDVQTHYNNKSFLNSGFTISIPEKFKDKKNIYMEVLKKNKWIKAKDISEEANDLVEVNAKEILKISKNFNPNVIIVDDFYENPDEVRSFALSCEFQAHDQYHKGQRTGSRYLPEGAKEVFEKLLQKKITKWEEHGSNGVFQFCIARDSLVYHVDMQSYAGMIFLTPDAPPSCGTSTYKSRRTGLRMSPTAKDAERLKKDTGTLHYQVFKNNFYDKTDLDVVDVAGNVYNRLVIFNAQAIHAASEYFGDAKENARLFQMFFFDVE